MDTTYFKECFPALENSLVREIERFAVPKTFAANEIIVKQGAPIHYLPLVLSGSVKVFSTEKGLQFLLYYITPGESCIYSFAHTADGKPAEFSAAAETESDLLLIPKIKVAEWLGTYPTLGRLLLSDYQRHYSDLLTTTKQITVYNLDQRLLAYLRTKAEISGSKMLSVTHQEIADDLGSSREVITRVLKKLSLENKVRQTGRRIKVL